MKRLFDKCLALTLSIFLTIFSIDLQLYNNLYTVYALSDIQNEYLEKIGAYAQQHYNETQILPSLVVAQYCQESFSNGRLSSLASKYRNYFGMKVGTSSYKGASVNMKTGEQTSSGSNYVIKANFRAYSSFEEGMQGYYAFLEYSNYRNLKGETDYKVACRKIKEDGWATDIKYTTHLIYWIENYNLTRFDSYKPIEWTNDYNGYYRVIGTSSDWQLNLRDNPSTSSHVVVSMNKGEIVKMTSCQTTKEWAKVEYNGITGYCKYGGTLLSKDISPSRPNVSVISGTSFTQTVINWNKCDRADYYEVKIDGVSHGTTGAISYGVTLHSGNHSVEVIAYSNNGSSCSSGTKEFNVRQTYPEKTNVTVHPGNSKSTTYVSWNQCNYADSYNMVIYNSAGTAIASQNNSNLDFETKLGAGSYYVIVTTHNNTDNTDTTSDRKNFTVEAAVPATPGLNVLPGNNYTDTSFSWNECQYADNYRLEVTKKMC